MKKEHFWTRCEDQPWAKSWQRETLPHRKQHRRRCIYVQMLDHDTYSPYIEYYSREIHIVESETGGYGHFRLEDEANMCTQKPLRRKIRFDIEQFF